MCSFYFLQIKSIYSNYIVQKYFGLLFYPLHLKYRYVCFSYSCSFKFIFLHIQNTNIISSIKSVYSFPYPFHMSLPLAQIIKFISISFRLNVFLFVKMSKYIYDFYSKGRILYIVFCTFFCFTLYHGNYFTPIGADIPLKGRVNVNIGFVTEKKATAMNNNILKP